jgi:hypothetical protein
MPQGVQAPRMIRTRPRQPGDETTAGLIAGAGMECDTSLGECEAASSIAAWRWCAHSIKCFEFVWLASPGFGTATK